jgi:hypothetical protein
MNKIILFSLILLLSACTKVGSDYQGGWVTHQGDCKETGGATITLNKNDLVHIEFFCFLKKCAEGKTKHDAAGYVYFDLGDGQFITGRIRDEEADGNWVLSMKGKRCKGHWAVLKGD